MTKTLGFCVEYHLSWFMVDNTIWLVGEHKNTSEMKSTCPQLHKTSKHY